MLLRVLVQAREYLPKMEEIEDTVGVYPNRTAYRRRVRPVSDGMDHFPSNRWWGHDVHLLLVLLIIVVHERSLAAFTTDSLSNVDARLGGIAGLARVGGGVDLVEAAL